MSTSSITPESIAVIRRFVMLVPLRSIGVDSEFEFESWRTFWGISNSSVGAE